MAFSLYRLSKFILFVIIINTNIKKYQKQQKIFEVEPLRFLNFPVSQSSSEINKMSHKYNKPHHKQQQQQLRYQHTTQTLNNILHSLNSTLIQKMVLPLFKVLSLIIRVFSKPLINYTKQVHLRNDAAKAHPYLRNSFISMGNTYNKFQTWINRKFMKIQTQFAYKPLNDQLAIEKGIQFFYQIVFYTIIIGLPLYQMWTGTVQAKAKSKVLEEKLRKIDQQLEEILKNQEFQKGKNIQKGIQIVKVQNNENKTVSSIKIQQIQQIKDKKTNSQTIKFVFPTNQNTHYCKIMYIPLKKQSQQSPQQHNISKQNQKPAQNESSVQFIPVPTKIVKQQKI